MSEDARFEDGGEKSLRLRAEDVEDLGILAALVQDAIMPGSEMSFDASRRRFACLVNRFRWEDRTARGSSEPERVRSLLVIDDARRVQHQGLDKATLGDAILSLLTLTFEPGEDGSGQLTLTFAGDGALKADVETVNVTLQDVTRPYRAVSGQAPQHPD